MFALLIKAAVIALAIVALAAITMLLHHGRQKWLATKFPPISDDEFMALCPPGTNRETALKVRRIVADQLGRPYHQVYPSSEFSEQDLLG